MNTLTPTFTSPQADTGALSLQLAADTLDEAWSWLCRSRENAPDHADIWALRHRWSQTRDALLAQLLSGVYRLTPMLITARGRKKKEALALWSARDALVLKWVALIIAPQLDIPAPCEHVKGHGGGPSSVARMTRSLVQHRWGWVCRTDVRGYYGSMNKQILLEGVFCQIKQPVLQDLITQYVHYTVEYGGEFYTPEKGIARGCALSPLMGALYLAQMDTYFSERAGMYYARYMDDVVILAKTRWQLRRHVRALNEFFNAGEVEQHPDKTFIGRTTRGFDWMGAQMGEHGVEGIAQRAKVNHRERLRRLYERFSRRPAEGRMRMSAYRRRWKIWAMATLCCTVAPHAALGGTTIAGGLGAIFPQRSIPVSVPSATHDVSSNTSIAGSTTWSSSPVRSTGRGYIAYAIDYKWALRLPWSIQAVGGNIAISGQSVSASVAGDCSFQIAHSGWVTLPTSSGPMRYNSITQSNIWVGVNAQPAGATYLYGADSFGSNLTTDIYADNPDDASANLTSFAKPDCRLTQLNVSITVTGDHGKLVLTPNNDGFYGLNQSYAVRGISLWAYSMPIILTDLSPMEIPIGNLPNCSAMDVSSNNIDLGTTSPRPAGGALGSPIATSKSGTVTINLRCSGPANNPLPAVATVYGSATSDFVSGDSTKLASTDPGLYLSLLAPTSWPAQVTGAPGQTAGRPLQFGSSPAAARALWAWAIPAATTPTTTSGVTLTPQVFMTGKDWNTKYGAATVKITLSAVIQ